MSEITRERLERCIVACAYIVVRHGPRYAPLLERLEQEHKTRFADPVAKAQAILDRYKLPRRNISRSLMRVGGLALNESLWNQFGGTALLP